MSRPRKAKPTKPAEAVATAHGLAKILRADRGTITRIVADLPPAGTDRTGSKTYRVSEVRAILATRRKCGTSPLRDQLIGEQIRKLKIANDAKERLVISRADIAAKLADFWSRVGEYMAQQIENEMPARMCGLDVPSGRVIAKRLNDTIRAQIVQIARDILPP